MSNPININPDVVVDKPNQFPWKLYDMLHTAEQRNEEHIISWINDGKAFKVHSRDQFIEQYMKKMFNQTKFKSFQRQLNLWGFERVQNGPNKGSYFHPLFLKGRRDRCQHLSRVRLKSAGEKTLQHGSLDKSESKLGSPSVSSTAAETISTSGVATFPITVTAPAVAAAGSISTSSPISFLGAFVDISPPASTTTTETSSHEDSRQQQFAELIQYHTTRERRDMIRNAAIGLSPDLSIAVVGAPIYATAMDTSKADSADIDQQQRHQDHGNQQHALPPTQQLEHQQKEELFINQQQQHEQTFFLQQQQQQQQQRIQLGQLSQIDRAQSPRRRSTSSGLEALLCVTAQRRREEEIALLKGLSDHGAMTHTG